MFTATPSQPGTQVFTLLYIMPMLELVFFISCLKSRCSYWLMQGKLFYSATWIRVAAS